MSRVNLLLLPVIFSLIIFSKPVKVDAGITGISAMDESFLMTVESVYLIEGRGTVATGQIERGIIKTDDLIEIVGFSNIVIKSKVTGVIVLDKLIPQAGKDENIGLILSRVEKKDVKRGMVICKPGSITAHTEFKCEITMMKSEGSKIVKPLITGDSLQFYFRNIYISGAVTLPTGKELQPANTATATVVLAQPIAMEKDLKFFLYRGEKIIGAGRVAAIIK